MLNLYLKLFLTHLLGLLLFATITVAEDPQSEDTVSFRYGIMGKSATAPDSLFRVDDQARLSRGDSISVNYRLKSNSSFYVIIQSGDDEYSLFHAASMQRGLQSADMVSASVEWIPVESERGFLRVFLIASHNPQEELEDLMEKYQISNNQLKQKYARRVTAELEEITLAEGSDYAVLPTRLRKPATIGATYRGEFKEEAILSYLFKQCSGVQTAYDVITIKQQ